MDERQRLICAVALHSDGFSCDEIAAALGATSEEAAALVAHGEKEQSEGRLGQWVGKGLLRLTSQERAWLDDLRRQFQQKGPGLVEDVIIYGPWARGIRDPEVDRHLLVVIGYEDCHKKNEVYKLIQDVDMRHGYAVCVDVRVITKEEFKRGPSWGPSYKGGISVA